jgi:hypothetical protein
MEAVTIAGIAVVVFGGFYSALDFLEDIGVCVKRRGAESRTVSFCRRSHLPSQRRVKKMAGMHV